MYTIFGGFYFNLNFVNLIYFHTKISTLYVNPELFKIYIFHTKFLIPINLNPQAPVAQKSADDVVFRHFQGP